MAWVHNEHIPDPHSDVAMVIAVTLVFSILACIAVAFRFWVRIRRKRSTWLDDYAALWSAVFGMAYACSAVAQTRWGLGLHAQYFPTENVVPFSKIQYAGGPMYTLALLGFKVALLASYLRIGGFVTSYRTVSIGAIIACIANQLAFTLVLLFACRPVEKQWDVNIPGWCINAVASYYALAATSLTFDIIIIVLPLPVLWSLQLRRPQKIAIMMLFTLGFFVTIIQIIRIFTISNLRSYTDSEPIIIWSDIEVSLGVIITCIPTYGPYFRSFRSFASSLASTRHPQHDQAYRLSSHPHTSSTTQTNGSGSRSRRKGLSRSTLASVDLTEFDLSPPRVFDNNIPHTTTIMSPKYGSQEHILPQSGGEEEDAAGGSERRESQGNGIQAVTEVKIERHEV